MNFLPIWRNCSLGLLGTCCCCEFLVGSDTVSIVYSMFFLTRGIIIYEVTCTCYVSKQTCFGLHCEMNCNVSAIHSFNLNFSQICNSDSSQF